MEPITINEILDATGGKLIRGDGNYLVKNISIDTRKILPGDLFIAIKGKTYDGHTFIQQAIEKGACGIMIDHQTVSLIDTPDINVLVVQNTSQALGNIAAYYRKKFSPIVVAITGSNGKTTTKDMASHILSSKYKVVKAPASFNNEIGVPLTVLQLSKETEVLILEMEMNILGGIKRLCAISQPQIGVITNIGDTHLEFLYSRDGVLKEKLELLESLTESGVAILNADDPMLTPIITNIKSKKSSFCGVKSSDNDFTNFKVNQLYTFGIEKAADIFAEKIIDHYEKGTEFLLCGQYPVKLTIPGIYNIYNALGAVCVARSVGCEFDEIVSRLAEFSPARMRMEKIEINGIVIYNDAFNANPQSMISALNTFAKFSPDQGKKIAVLSDMLELGDKSIELHQLVGNQIPQGIDILLTVGTHAQYIAESAQRKENLQQVIICRDHTEAFHKLVDILNPNDKILIKGSRLMKLELIIEKLKEYYSNSTKQTR